VNKSSFIDYIVTHVLKQINVNLGHIETTSIDYNALFEFCINNGDLLPYLSKRKTPAKYVNFCLKVDSTENSFKIKLYEKISALTDKKVFIIHNKNNIVITHDNTIKSDIKKNKINPVINTLDLSDDSIKRFSCVYNKTIKNTKQGWRNKFNLSIVNEAVFNVYFQSIINDENWSACLDNVKSAVIDTYFEYKLGKISIFQKQGCVKIGDISFDDNFIYNCIYQNDVNKLIKNLKSVKPLQGFIYLKNVINLYLIFKTNNIDKIDFLNYITFINFDVIKRLLVKKYFNKIEYQDIYKTFYKGKIDDIIMDKVGLIKEFIHNLNEIENKETELQEFIISYYKFYVYMKNILNREIKILAQDYYHRKINVIDVISDDCLYSIGEDYSFLFDEEYKEILKENNLC
jgi:hypothetical protein